MGQFSWLDCKDGSQILDDAIEEVYLLIPKDFGGGHIKETCYDGYGHFGGKDAYDLVADWNREWLSKTPRRVLPYSHSAVQSYGWYEKYANLSADRETVVKDLKPGFAEWRGIGIDLACYDEDNASLKYPLKITHDPYAVYEQCSPSPSDPDQGWDLSGYDDDDEEDWSEPDYYDDDSEYDED